MNKSKRSLRSTLAELAATFADAVLDAARESLLERTTPLPQAIAKRERPRAARAPAPAPRTKRARGIAPEVAAPSMTSDLLITDPQALLAALETAAPQSAHAEWDAVDEVVLREEPEILRPVSAVTPAAELAPSLREGEVLVRRSGAGVVFRRRRA